MQTQHSTEIQQIEICQLVTSERNVRKTKGNNAADKALIASIGAVGLLNNLVVTPAEEKGTFAVEAGGRRFAALQALVKAGKIEATAKVPCKVVSGEGGTAEEISLAENIMREAMHPADEFEAFQTLIEAGLTVKDVAAHFGTTQPQVNKRLKLAGVAPQILTAYRKGDLDLDCVMAFTLEADHTRQRAIWKEIKGGHFNAHTIRRAITESSLSSDHRLVKFVTVVAYKAAGGPLTEDLFSDDSDCYLEDVELVQTLALAKLEETAECLGSKSGWGWVEVGLIDDAGLTEGMGQIHAEPPKEWPDDLLKEDALLTELEDALNDIPEDDWIEDMDAQMEDIWEKQGVLRDKMDALEAFDPEQQKLAGCVVTVGYSGDLLLREGLVRKADQAALSALLQGESTGADSTGGEGGSAVTRQSDQSGTEAGEKGYSNALAQDLTAYRLAVAKAQLAAHPAVAKDLLGYTLAIQVLKGRHAITPFDIGSTITTVQSSRDDIAGSPLEAAIEAGRKKLALGWLAKKFDAKRFDAYCALKPKEKDAITAFCAAQSLHGQLIDGSNAIIEAGLARCTIDWAKHWRPTAESFFSRITKPELLGIGTELAGEDWASSRGKLKKGELAERVEELINGKGCALTKDQQAACAAWLPKGFK